MGEKFPINGRFCTKFVAQVCPYGIIRTNRKTLALQRVERFVLILFPLKTPPKWGAGEGVKKQGLHIKDKFFGRPIRRVKWVPGVKSGLTLLVQNIHQLTSKHNLFNSLSLCARQVCVSSRIPICGKCSLKQRFNTSSIIFTTNG